MAGSGVPAVSFVAPFGAMSKAVVRSKKTKNFSTHEHRGALRWTAEHGFGSP
jgi:hypothetical protein